jgi:hypothetical protein
VHYTIAAITPASASSLQHFLKSFQDKNFVSNIVVVSLIMLIMIPREPLSVPYVFFISSARDFSLVLSYKYCSGFSPSVGNPVVYAFRYTSIDIGVSIHRIPPCTNATSCFTQLFTYFPLPKWGISNRFTIHVLYNPAIHYFGYKIRTSNGPVPFLSI